MEDTGYLARAAFLVDRAMRSVGLSGQRDPAALELRVRGAGDHGDARDSDERSDRDDPGGAVDDLLRAVAGYALLIAAFVPCGRSVS